MNDITEKLILVKDYALESQLKSWIELMEKRHNFTGTYDVYCLYKKENSQVYALIHADHKESNSVNESNIETIVAQESKILHSELKHTEMPIDFFFIMPYFEYKTQGSTLFTVIVTSQFDN